MEILVGKKVVYNGGAEKSKRCPLEVGKSYNVIMQENMNWQTNLVLEGVEGTFNSAWFSVEKAPSKSKHKAKGKK